MDVRSKLWISLLVFGLICDGILDAAQQIREGNLDSRYVHKNWHLKLIIWIFW